MSLLTFNSIAIESQTLGQTSAAMKLTGKCRVDCGDDAGYLRNEIRIMKGGTLRLMAP